MFSVQIELRWSSNQSWRSFTESLQADHVIQDRNIVLTTSHQYAGQNLVGLCSLFRPITAIRFSDDHGWPDLAFGKVIGSIQTLHIQEAQQMRTMLPQPSGETEIIRVFQITLPGDQGIQLSFQGLGTLDEESRIQLGFLCFQYQRSPQQGGSIPGKLGCPTGFTLFDLFQVKQQVREAFLFEPVFQSFVIIGQET